jgi:MoxR-like ATPase
MSPLPEAQLDRFLVQVDVDYPTRATERDILIATTGIEDAQVHQVFTAEGLIAAQGVIRRMPVGDQVVEAILDLVRACRPGEPEGRDLADSLSWGPGPRAAQALMLTVRARALLDGRLAPSVADVASLAQAVLVHRMALSFAARARGETMAGIISRVTGRVLGLEAAA